MHLDLLTHSLTHGASPMCRWSAGDPVRAPQVQETLATAIAAAHARKAPHRIRHACSNRKGCSRALDLASWATKVYNPGDHLPPTSMARTTSSTHQLWASTFLAPPGSLEHHPCRLLLCAANHRNARHTPAWCPTENGQPRDHFQSAIVCGFWERQIEIRDQNVGSHGHLLRGTLELQRSRVQNLADPMPLFWCMMHSGDQTNRLDGHTSTCTERTAVGGGGDGAKWS